MPKLTNEQIVDILLKQSYVDKNDVEQAKAKVSDPEKILDSLLDSQALSKDILGQALGEYYGVPYASVTKVDEEVFSLIPELVAEARGVVAFAQTDRGVKVGMLDPHDLETRHLIQKRLWQEVFPYFITEKDLTNVLVNYKASLKDEVENLMKGLLEDGLTKDERDEMTVTLVDTLLRYGEQNKASDVHIEPYEKKIVVRFRIDGMMHDVLELPKDLSEFIISRIKVLARMRTDEHRAAQDGKIRFKGENETVDVRVSVVPVTQGENVVMRLLSSKNRQFTLADLGLGGDGLKKVKRAIKHPHGMILVTGPTGSGKTTTLYAVLKILNKRNVHISTIEDPVEYDVEGVSQIQVNTKTDLTFAKGLRAIVRQDPDIIMVGEIRDEETASIAVNSALTGHLVLSTLHTNDAPTALPRLLDMKVEPFLVSSTVNLIVAQRLVRKICSKCRVSYSPEKSDKKMIENSLIKDFLTKKGRINKLRLYKGAGCKICNNTGYVGRVGIFEILEMTEKLGALVVKNASSDDLRNVAKEDGMKTLLEDGVDKVLSGVTTLEEVLRVASD